MYRISDLILKTSLLVAYTITLFFLTVYSYSQIDLNLTLSSNPTYQPFQQKLIYLGYFNRPLSTSIFLILLFLLFFFYLLSLYLVKKRKLERKDILLLILLTTGILFLAYPAFSHDLFNYMFDARIVTKYGLNPYFYKAGDFPSDHWIRFMHWTHRTYPYGPFWLLFTLPFSFFGFAKFVLTLFNFKLMFTIFHLGNIYLVWKIAKKINKNNSLLATVFYAFNPLIIIESLLSPHNEVLMLFFLLMTIYLLYIKKRFILSLFGLFISAGVKFATIIILPVLLIKKKTTNHLLSLRLMFYLLVVSISVQIYFREPFSWYFIPLIGLGALQASRNMIIFISGISLGTLLRYAPFLYHGSYPDWISDLQDWLFIIPLALSFLLISVSYFKKVDIKY